MNEAIKGELWMKKKKNWLIYLFLALFVGVLVKNKYDENIEQVKEEKEKNQAHLALTEIISENNNLSIWGELTVDTISDEFIFTFNDDEFEQEILESIKSISERDINNVMKIIGADHISDLDAVPTDTSNITSDWLINLEIYRITTDLGVWNLFVDQFTEISQLLSDNYQLDTYNFIVPNLSDNEYPLFEANNGEIIYNFKEDFYY